MTEFMWGLLALPAVLIALALAVILPLGALALIEKAKAWRTRKLQAAERYEWSWGTGVSDEDNRLWIAAAVATSEKATMRNTPFGVTIKARGRWDRKATYRLRELLREDLRRPDSDRGIEPR